MTTPGWIVLGCIGLAFLLGFVNMFIQWSADRYVRRHPDEEYVEEGEIRWL